MRWKPARVSFSHPRPSEVKSRNLFCLSNPATFCMAYFA